MRAPFGNRDFRTITILSTLAERGSPWSRTSWSFAGPDAPGEKRLSPQPIETIRSRCASILNIAVRTGHLAQAFML